MLAGNKGTQILATQAQQIAALRPRHQCRQIAAIGIKCVRRALPLNCKKGEEVTDVRSQRHLRCLLPLAQASGSLKPLQRRRQGFTHHA